MRCFLGVGPWLVKYREAVKRFVQRWICRQSQKERMSLRGFQRYLERQPLVVPYWRTDLIALCRELAATMMSVTPGSRKRERRTSGSETVRRNIKAWSMYCGTAGRPGGKPRKQTST